MLIDSYRAQKKKQEIISRWLIPFEELEIQSKIGMGDFGVVFLAKWRNSKGAALVTRPETGSVSLTLYMWVQLL